MLEKELEMREMECTCGLREEFEKMKEEKEKDCRSKLMECRKSQQSKDRQLKELKKKNTTMLIMVVIVATVLGKETVDGIASWVESLNSVKAGVERLTTQADDPFENHEWQLHYGGVSPSPGALPLFAIAAFASKRRRRR